jgi:hypothetical protein
LRARRGSRELKAEIKVVEAEIAELRKRVVPLPPRVSEERVRRYLEKLRDRVDTRPEYQRVLRPRPPPTTSP